MLTGMLLAFVSVSVQAQDSALKVKAIDVRGNKRIETTALRGRITLKPGDPYTAESIRSQIRLIYEMGFFEDVQIETERVIGGVALTFVVREKPFITEIVFDGNQALSDEKLQEKTTIRSQSFLDQQQAKESAEKIRLAYQEDGYYSAQVIPIVQTLDEDRKRLTFYVKEGDRAKVKTVIFEGAKSVTKKEMFKLMATREWVYLISNFTDAGVLKREEMNNDVERIREVYLNKGFLNVQVGVPTIELTPDKKWFIITFPVVEGEQFTVSEVGFRGNTVFEEPELMAGSKVKAGEVFQRAKIRDEITRLTELYGGKGYAFTDVNPTVTPDPDAKTAKILLHIKEGELIRIREIHITGNDKTRDNVIRREVRLDEQDVIDTVAIKRSFQRLNNLNFFETVEILPKPVDADKVDLDVKVKEKSTGQFSIGGGFSTLDRFVAVADITEGNLGGNGYMGRIRGQLGQMRTLGVVTFRDPYLNDSLTSFQGDIYKSTTDYLTYFEDKAGISATLGRWFSEYSSGSFALMAEQLNYYNPSVTAPSVILLQVGNQTTTGFRSSLARDSRDYYMDPRSGMRNAINLDLGTPYLGGTNNFVKYVFDTIYYVPLPYDIRNAFRVRVGAAEGLGNKPIPLTERFFVGGINTMRGFQFGRAGPVTSDQTLIGAARELIFNYDFIFTVSAEAKLNAVIFFDYGKGFDDNEKFSFNLRKSAGLEGRWISPFGPLRAAYGLNLAPLPGEQKAVFEFSVGQLF
ncbi:MAG: outer membrane protein assembly factor BamA [Nitrospirota bacterium]|nr:outer membrane protein assembly factor BamA [Nitrospirota bacterium]MDE3226538.1 outer membrane protein assembly factor BamA [Nitrospirota bacterium]MDE3244199.1 outer membrane protein assembly factor BamA [Nitrospirota bacterium]